MDVKKYIVRSLHYAIRLVLLLAIVFVILHFTGTLNTGGAGFFEALFMSTRGAILIAILILLAGLYPRWAFGAVRIEATVKENREQIMKAFEMSDYVLEKEQYPEMIFRAKTMKKKILMQFDDAMTVIEDSDSNFIYVEGHKKELGKIELRIKTLIDQQ